MANKTKSWERIDDMLTPKGIEEIQPGAVLTFEYEGSITSLRVMRKVKGKVWAKQITLYNPDDVEVVDK